MPSSGSKMAENGKKMGIFGQKSKKCKKMPIFSTLKSISEILAGRMNLKMVLFASELNSDHFQKKKYEIS